MNQFIDYLHSHQHPTGYFPTYVVTRDREVFEMGSSPFVTAHILCLLHDIQDDRLNGIKQNALSFLESLDKTGLKVYKFWYDDVEGTAYPHLPFDLDDTAVVNQALLLYQRDSMDARILSDNVSKSGLFRTWFRPSLKSLLKNPKLILTVFSLAKSFRLFMSNRGRPPMARFNDSEAIVHMNVSTFMALNKMGSPSLSQGMPLSDMEVDSELKGSLHYDSACMYYMALARFQRFSRCLNSDEVEALAEGISSLIRREAEQSLAERLTLLTSLYYLNKLSNDYFESIMLAEKEILTAQNIALRVCVGNKNYSDAHAYVSCDITIAMMIVLSSIVRTSPDCMNDTLCFSHKN
jgi:hypothetical protein